MKAKFLFTVVSLFFFLLAPCLNAEEENKPLEIGDTVEDVGTFVDLEGGEKLQLVLEGNDVVAHLVDAENVIIENEIESILFSVDDGDRRGDEFRTILRPAGEARLIGTQMISPPYQMRARIIIRYEDSDPTSMSRVQLDLERNLENN